MACIYMASKGGVGMMRIMAFAVSDHAFLKTYEQ